MARAESAALTKAVPALPYRAVPNFFQLANGNIAEVSGVAVNSLGHIFVFQRRRPMLCEFDNDWNYRRVLGYGLLAHQQGCGLEAQEQCWTTDDDKPLVLTTDAAGYWLSRLGRSEWAPASERMR